jgi:hypothetical protein
MADPLSSVLDDVLRLDKILSTDGGVLIIDQICLVIPDPRRFPDVNYWHTMRTRSASNKASKRESSYSDAEGSTQDHASSESIQVHVHSSWYSRRHGLV